jgi:glutamate-1-semialdehyde aminotransferase
MRTEKLKDVPFFVPFLQDVTNLRTSKENTDGTIPIRDLLNLSLKNHGVYTPRRVMLCISSPMTEKELDQAVSAFEASLDQLKPIIEKKFPELLV